MSPSAPMTAQSPFAALVPCLESELEAQRGVARRLDAATAAAASRNLAALEEELRGLDSETRHAKQLASRRQHLTLGLGAARRAPSLGELARLPGAPAEKLTQLRDELRQAVEAVASRTRRMQSVVRELGELYGSAITVLLQGAAPAEPGASAPCGSRSHGALVNMEA